MNVASTAGLRARPNLAAYAAAKGGVIAFSRQLALDVAADRIRVNVVAPGSVRTPLTAPVYGAHARPASILGRVAEPEEIAATACFLLADDSSFYTGSVFAPRRRTDGALNGYPHLFEPGAIAGLELKNRVVQTPMGTGLIDMGRVTTREVAFQEERARGGVGLMITGAAVVHPTSRFPARIIVEAWDPEGVPALRLRTDVVHRHGARIFGQLIHLGRESPGGQTDFVPMGPSARPHDRDPGCRTR